MNQNSGKPSSRISRAGIAKFRPLTPNEQTSKSSTADLPNGWFYNEPKEKNFWKDIEESTTPEKQMIIEETNKTTDYMSQVGESATRLQTIITKIDDIDQETLLEMMQIGDEIENSGESDPNKFLDDSKTQIVSYLTEIDELAQGQKTLVENLGVWFDSLSRNETFLEHEKSNQPEEPNRDDVYSYLHGIIDDYLQKSEKAQFLHNDVSDFWKKQNSTFKRILGQKDIEIQKLKTVIEQNEKQKIKKIKQKQSKNKSAEEIQKLNEQISNQLRIIEEQKGSIEKLKKQLQDSELTSAMAIISKSGSQPIDNSKINSISAKFEYETQLSILNQRIDQLQTENFKLSKNLSDLTNANKKLAKENENKELLIQELEANNRKNLRLLQLEQEKPVNEPLPVEKPEIETNDQLVIELQEKIQTMEVEHKKEMLDKEELLKAKFLIEKQKLFESLDANDNTEYIKKLVNDYESQILDNQKKFNNLFKEINESFSNKLLNLTNKYESTIKKIVLSNQIEIQNLQKNLNYEVNKKSIELEEEFNKKLVEELKKRNEKDNSNYDQLAKQLENSNSIIESIVKYIQNYSGEIANLPNEIQTIIHNSNNQIDPSINSTNDQFTKQNQNKEIDSENNSNQQINLLNTKNLDQSSNENNSSMNGQLSKADSSLNEQIRNEIDLKQYECDLLSKSLLQIELIKNEYDFQLNWLLEQQKQSLTQKFEQDKLNDQSKLKSCLSNLTKTLTNLDDQQNLNECLQCITDAYVELNDSIIENSDSEVMIPIDEVKKRLQTYQNRIEQLKSTIQLNSMNPTNERNQIATNDQNIIANQVFDNNPIQQSSINDQNIIDSNNINQGFFNNPIEQNNFNQLFTNPLQQNDFDQLISNNIEQNDLNQLLNNPIQQNNFNAICNNNNIQNNFNEFYQNQNYSSFYRNFDLNQGVIFHYEPHAKISVQRSLPQLIPLSKPKSLTRSTSQTFLSTPLVKLEKIDITINSSEIQLKTVCNPKTVNSSQIYVNSIKPSIFTQLDTSKFYKKKSKNFHVSHNMSVQTNVPHFQLNSFFVIEIRPVVVEKEVEVDQETNRLIDELQNSIKQLEEGQKNGQMKNEMFTQMRINIIDSSNKIIEKQKKTIEELLNRKPQVVYQTQIVTVPAEQLEPIQNRTKPIYQFNTNSIPFIPPKSNSIKIDHNNSQNQKTELKIAQNDQNSLNFNQNDKTEAKNDHTYHKPIEFVQNNEIRNKLNSLDILNLNADDIEKDPFTCSIQLIASIIRFLTNFNLNSKMLLSTFKNDLNAYDAYLQLIESTDQSSFQFLYQIKQSCSNIEYNSEFIDKLFNSQLQLLEINKKLKHINKIQTNQLNHLQLKLNEKELDTHKQILNDVQIKDQSPLQILTTLKTTLEAIKSYSNNDDLLLKINENIKNCENSIPVDQVEIENLIKQVTERLNQIQLPKQTTAPQTDQKQLEKLKKSKHNYKQKYQEQIHINQHLTSQITTLQHRIQEEQNLNENAIALYKSNIRMLKELFNQLQIDDNPDLVHLASIVKQEVLQLQSLIELTQSELYVYKNKANDLQDMLDIKDKQISKLLTQIEALEKKELKLTRQLQTINQNEIELKSNLDFLQKENVLTNETGNKNVSQLNSVIKENHFINQQLYALNKNEIKLKNRIRELELDKEELEIKSSLFGNKKQDLISIDTQTVLRIKSFANQNDVHTNTPRSSINQINSEKNEISKNDQIKKEINSNEQSRKNDQNATEIDKNNQVIKENNDQISNENNLISNKISKNDQISNEISKNDQIPRTNNDKIDLNKANLNEIDEIVVDSNEIEWQLTELSNDTDSFNDQFIQINDNNEKFYSIEDKIPERVHQPINYKQKVKNKKIPNLLNQTTRRPQTSHGRPVSKPIENDLSIGQTIPGQRALPGQIGRIKPTINNRTAIAMKAILSPHASPKQVLPIKATQNYKFNDNRPTKPKEIHKNNITLNTKQTNETIIITHAEFAQSENENDKKIIVQPIDQSNLISDINVSRSPTVVMEQKVDVDELEKIILKLQQKIRELSRIIQDKESDNNELKKKFAETYKVTQQQELKIVRLTSNNKKSEARSENLQSRLDLLMTEISIRNDENIELRKEIQKMRKIIQPTSTMYISIKNSQMKKLMLKREKAKQKVLLNSALNAIGATNDPVIKKQLGTLLQNTQRSISRIEAKKKKYKEDEQKQIFMALSALSLINDSNISNEALNKLTSSINNRVYTNKANSLEHSKKHSVENNENFDLKRKFPSNEHALEVINKIDTLNEEEKSDIVSGEMKNDTWNKIIQYDQNENQLPELTGNKLDL